MNKSIDFDAVADLYDLYVDVDFDIPFWLVLANQCSGGILELMCGAGRIGLPLLQTGIDYTGVDYSSKLLDQFRAKVPSAFEPALVEADAREFRLERRFDLIFIGFHSLSEVVDNQDKARVFQQVTKHLEPSGTFVFSLQNSEAKARSIRECPSGTRMIPFSDGSKALEFSYQLESPTADGVVVGVQHYTIVEDKKIIEQRELPIRFHLIEKAEIVSLLAVSGFQVVSVLGDYDGSKWSPTSPFLIMECRQNA